MQIGTKLLVSAAAVVVFFGIFPARGADLTSQDRKFMEEAAKGGMMEVHMGHLAVSQGMDPAVKKFGERMVKDHTKANHEFADLAKKKSLTLPPDDPNMVDKSLAKKTGADFDKAYGKDMVKDHEDDIAAFEKEVNSGTDPDIKKLASKTLPTLRSHLAEAKTLPQ